MPFDSFMTSALARELSDRLVGLKVDRIFQPERDEIDLVFHTTGRNRLVINCTASTPYMALSSETRENPATPPMLCMLLRKHLSRAKITDICQLGFDRTIRISLDSGDELGFRKSKYLYCEMMGRGSNLVFADENNKILAAFRQNDITTKFDRVVMVGFPYKAMPPQEKLDPMTCSKEDFVSAFSFLPVDSRCDLAIQKLFSGFGKLTAREIVFRACGDCEAVYSQSNQEKLWEEFSAVVNLVKNCDFSPCLIFESYDAYQAGESPLDFSFMPIRQFSSPFFVYPCSGASEAIEWYYSLRNQKERQKQHHNDIAQILKNCKNRLEKKISAQMQQLEDSADADEKKRFGDLVMQEMYRIRRGDHKVDAMDYETGTTVSIPLDPVLTPSQNAQQFYREYNKKKTAILKTGEQIDIAKNELRYVESVMATLETATSAKDLSEIREELSHWSYGRRLTSGLKKPQKKKSVAKPLEGKTQGGFTVLLGMNNLQNDAVSCHHSRNDDVWFHVKNYHGSHVLLKYDPEKAFSDADLEEAASYAAYYSEVKNSDKVEVDYTKAQFVKKPNGSKPGFVTYKNHNTALVTPRKLK